MPCESRVCAVAIKNAGLTEKKKYFIDLIFYHFASIKLCSVSLAVIFAMFSYQFESHF